MDYPAASLSELVSFLDSQDEPSIVMDADYCILAANRAYTAAFGRMGAVTGLSLSASTSPRRSRTSTCTASSTPWTPSPWACPCLAPN